MAGRSKRKSRRIQSSIVAQRNLTAHSYALPCALLFLGVFLLYAGSYRYPLVFDDKIINPVQLPELAASCGKLSNRCLSYSTFGLTYLAVGLDLFWFRFGNVLAHALASLACFLFFDRLFDAVRRVWPDDAGLAEPGKDRLLAFCGAVLFAVHPVTVYGVAYLTQRSIVMATLFSLLSLAAFVRSLTEGDRRWLWVSVALYGAALLSKEHVIVLPAVAIAIAVLLGKQPIRSRLEWAVLAAAVIAAVGLIATRLTQLLGAAQEYYTRELTALKELGMVTLDPANAYGGSVLTQAYLFFKYLLLWVIPYPGWMSVDLRQPIADGPFAWPYALGVPAFLAYGAAAIVLLLRRGAIGLLGLGLLFPWLLYFTEFVTARIQEPFVLYRGYLWMVGLVAVVPYVTRRLTARHLVVGCSVLAIAFSVAMRERLATFASNLALWDDVVRKNTDLSLIFVDRGYGNRAVALLREGRLDEALRDLDMTLRLNPQSSHAYVNRAAVLSQRGEEKKALEDLDRAIQLDPSFAEAHSERCAALLKKDDLRNALESCNTALRLAPALPTALLNRAVLHARSLRRREALADLDRVLKFEPTNALALYNRGMVYREMGRAAESGKDLRASCGYGFGPACAAMR